MTQGQPERPTEWDTDGLVRCEPAGSGYRVILVGEVDMTLAAQWDVVFATLADVSACDVTVDLSAATFIDSSALGSLVRLNRQVTSWDREVVLAGASGSVARTLQLSGIDLAIRMATYSE